MIHRRYILSCAALAAFLIATSASRAFEFRSGEITNTLACPAGTRFASETVLAAYDIATDATAARDLWILGNSARLGGVSEQDARVLSKSVVVDGTVGQNLQIFAQAAQLTTNAVVKGDLLLLGNTLVCEGSVAGDVWLSGGEVTLSGSYGGNVRAFAETLRLSPGTRIDGDFLYTTPAPFALPPGVEIGGQVRAVNAVVPRRTFRDILTLRGFFFIGALLVGMPFVGLFPGVAGGSVRALRLNPWRCLFMGLAILFCGPFLIVLAFTTVFGVPLALVAGALWMLTLYLSHIVVALLLGHWLVGRRMPVQTFSSVFFSLAAGLFILYFASAFPRVMDIFALPVVVIGMGALWRNLFHPVALRRVPPIPPLPSGPPPPPPPPNTPS